MKVSRASAYRNKQRNQESELNQLIITISQEKVIWGINKVLAYIRYKYRVSINRKRVTRIRKKYSLQSYRRKIRKRRIKNTTPIVQSTTRPNEIWSYDFKQDRTIEGKAARILVICDEYTRECIWLQAGRTFKSTQVIKALKQARVWTGRSPQYIRSDNGPEFRSRKLLEWIKT